MSELIDTTEMYLKTVYELLEEGIVPMRARITERLDQSGPTVSQTVGRMERYGLITVEEDRHLELTDEGWALAAAVMRKHRLVELLLFDVIGLEWNKLHEEACRWEHVVSADVERKLVDILPNPCVCPYGNPVPGLDELRLGEPVKRFDAKEFAWGDSLPLSELLSNGETKTLVIERFAEIIQTFPDVINNLYEAKIRPKSVVSAKRVGEMFSLQMDDYIFDFDEVVAAGIFVKVAPEES